jgi:hypothetical protein
LLEQHRDLKLTVLVVWEPILSTDWWKPNTSTMSRIPDTRVQQFWDPKHLVASALNEMATRNPPQPQPQCCFHRGHYWDDAILFGPGKRWEDSQSTKFWDGPVFQIIPGLEKSLAVSASGQ